MTRLLIEGLRFRYPSVFPFSLMKHSGSAIGPIDCILDSGFYSLIGPNGSGKSTLLKLIAGIMEPGEGEIVFNDRGQTIKHPELKRLIGYTPQVISVYEQMNVNEYLTYIGKLKLVASTKLRLPALIEQSLEATRLEDYSNRSIRELSTGMRRRLMLAQALLGQPRILLLDEPFTGLDIEERAHVMDLLADLSQDRIVIAAHHLPELIQSPFDRKIEMIRGPLSKSVYIEVGRLLN